MSTEKILKIKWMAYFILILLTGACHHRRQDANLLLIHDPESSFIAHQIETLCREQGFHIQKTTNLSYCDEDSLKNYNAVIIDIPIDTLNHRQQTDLERYVLAGGGLMGINIQTNYMHKWPWMENLLHNEVSAQKKSGNFIMLAAEKKSNVVDGITTQYGIGRVCVVYTKNLSQTKQNLENAISYTIDHEQKLGYQYVQKMRVPSPTPFSAVEVVNNLSEPTDMEVLPDGNVIFTEKNGNVKFFDAVSHETRQIALFHVNDQDCFGLTSIALDADFKKNHWVYLSYKPYSDAGHQYISRFFMAEDSLIMHTEKVILKIDEPQSAITMLEFDENRNLYVGISACSGNELSVYSDESEEVQNQEQSSIIYGKQDFYLKLSADIDSTLVLADSTLEQYFHFRAENGPQYLSSNQNDSYVGWGGLSIYNDSSKQQPSYDLGYKFPYLKYGNYYLFGPDYHFDLHSTSPNKLPEYYDNKLFLADWEKNQILVATLNNSNRLDVIEPLLDLIELNHPVRLKFAPDGSLFVLEHGPDGYLSHEHARLSHITFSYNNRVPIAKIDSDVRSGGLPLKVNFSSSESFDYDRGDTLNFEWVFPDTLINTHTKSEVSYIFDQPGVYHPTVIVYDQRGKTSQTSMTVTAGNPKPEISIETENNRSFYWKANDLPYAFKVLDKFDELKDSIWHKGSVNLYIHPHDQLFHTVTPIEIPIKGTLELQSPDKDSLLNYTMVVNYEDKKVNEVPGNKIQEIFNIQYPQLQAVKSDESLGVLNRVDDETWFVKNGGYILFRDIDLREIKHLKYRIKPLVDGYMEMRLNAPTGPVVSTLRMNSRESWAEFTVRVGQIEGSYDLYFVFRQKEESTQFPPDNVFCMLEWIYFGKERIGAFYTSPDAKDLVE